MSESNADSETTLNTTPSVTTEDGILIEETSMEEDDSIGDVSQGGDESVVEQEESLLNESEASIVQEGKRVKVRFQNLTPKKQTYTRSEIPFISLSCINSSSVKPIS